MREKLGRALQDYVGVEVREQAAAQATAQEAALARVLAELAARHEETRAELRSVEQRLEASMRAWERRQRRDLFTAGEQDAARSSAEFWHRELQEARPYFRKEDTLAAALRAAPTDGLFLEFGVYSGGTLRQIVEAAPAGTVYGFDSFQGLPEAWRPTFEAGAFAVDAPPEVPGAELVVGWFADTLPGFLAEHPEPVAFLHLDADLYSSTTTVLDALEPRLRPGTVLLFDEYFNFPDWQDHEHRAWTEFAARTGLTWEYLGFTADDEQLALRLTAVPTRG
jgi:hypothetical protein